jgi:hypothetical protein
VSGYTWYAAEATSFIKQRGWQVTEDVRKHGVTLMVAPYKDVQV